MNMLLGMLKNLFPREGDYRVIWAPGASDPNNNVCITVWKISEHEKSAQKVLGAVIDWPKR